jgi:hypothetical protein
MITTDDTILVFTSRDTEELVREGGSQAWKLDPIHAATCRYLVCVWNAFGDHDGQQDAAHGSAFLIAAIDGIEPAPERADRYIVRFSRWAPLSVTGAWGHWRNPVKYTSLDELGIDPTILNGGSEPREGGPVAMSVRPMTMAEARRSIAAYYDVSPLSIEITIRG